jgi:N-acetylglucosaminyldiphosphoundecaprenol N-acetyl-beta-D-mannosaminyltransferase
VSLSGVLVDRVDRVGARAALERFLTDGGRHQIVTVNTDFVRLADRNPAYRSLLNGADLAVADGMPLVWLSRLAGNPLSERVAGIELVDSCCRLAAREGIPLFLLGAGPGVAPAAAHALTARHPGLRVVGTFTPAFGPATAEGDAEMVAKIREAGRCVLLVAFGAPRQDLFIRSHLQQLDVPIAMGVGCALDIFSGAVRRAPAWMQASGLEWLWRMAQEPRRLWRRYLLQDVPFLFRLGARTLRARAAVSAP